jgi:hypothetical protein
VAFSPTCTCKNFWPSPISLQSSKLSPLSCNKTSNLDEEKKKKTNEPEKSK